MHYKLPLLSSFANGVNLLPTFACSLLISSIDKPIKESKKGRPPLKLETRIYKCSGNDELGVTAGFIMFAL